MKCQVEDDEMTCDRMAGHDGDHFDENRQLYWNNITSYSGVPFWTGPRMVYGP